MSEQSPYRLYLSILRQVCDELPCIRDEEDMNKLIEYGWVKKREMATDYKPLFEGDVRCDLYMLTAKGHFVLSPRENRADGLPVPFFVAKGRPFTVTSHGELLWESAS